MKVALIGYGRMGRLVEEVAAEQGLEIAARLTSASPLLPGAAGRALLAGAEVGIDFSTAAAVPATVRAAADLGLPLAVGTTGWQGELEALRRVVEEAGAGLVHGANFSLGVNLFYRVVARAARAFAPFDAYDPFVAEEHHKAKLDRPSGTALELRRLLARAYGERPVETVSLRAGHVPGTHVVGFEGRADAVRLEHRARSRRGFADGALLAARWIAGRKGFYSFQDILDDVFPS